LAVREMGYTGAEVARFLGVTTSSVNRLAVSEKTADLKKLIKMF
jgi:predicted transcriptional regulator